MPSPFPGMNPYLERETVWHDYHERFCPLVADLLGSQVLPNFIVKLDEHVYIRELPADPRHFVGRGDVLVAQFPSGSMAASSSAVLTAPARVSLPRVDEERLSYIEIRDRDDWRLITVIELLSPTNKYAGPDREQYIAKRAQILNSPTHFVELDLLRGGPRLPMENLPPCAYYVMVSRAEQRPQADLWPIPLRDRLPVIPIPLTSAFPDARLDLQAVLDRIYDAAGYAYYVYRHPPQPRLAPEDAAWVQPLVPEP